MSAFRLQSRHSIAILFACAFICSPLMTVAQEYKELTTAVPLDSKAKSKASSALKSPILGGKVAPELQQMVDYYLELMTRKSHWGSTSASDKMNPGLLRKEIRTRALMAAKDPSVHDWMVKEILTRCAEYARSKEYHPFVRMNAMLMIAELNQREQARDKPIIPSPEALDVILAELENPNQLEAVKLAALVGLERQVKYGFVEDDEDKRLKGVERNLSKYAQMQGDKEDAKVRWYRRRGIQLLALHGQVGKNGSIVQMLGRIAADPNASVIVRSEAANALGSFDARKTNLDKDLNYPLLCELYAKIAIEGVQGTKDAQGVRSLAMRLQLKEYIAHIHFAFNGPRIPLSQKDNPDLPHRGIFANKSVPASNNALKSEYSDAFSALYDAVKKDETDEAIDIKAKDLENVMKNNIAKKRELFLAAAEG